MAVRAGVEPRTFRLKVIDSIKAPPCMPQKDQNDGIFISIVVEFVQVTSADVLGSSSEEVFFPSSNCLTFSFTISSLRCRTENTRSC